MSLQVEDKPYKTVYVLVSALQNVSIAGRNISPTKYTVFDPILLEYNLKI